jgi:hypothetical protein
MSNNITLNKRKIITSDIIQLFQWNVIDLMFVSSVSPLASDKSIPFSSLLLLFNARTFDIEQSFHQQKFDFPKQISFFDNNVETESADIVFANDNEFYLYNNLIEFKKQNSSCFNIYIVQNKATKNNQFIIELLYQHHSESVNELSLVRLITNYFLSSKLFDKNRITIGIDDSVFSSNNDEFISFTNFYEADCKTNINSKLDAFFFYVHYENKYQKEPILKFRQEFSYLSNFNVLKNKIHYFGYDYISVEAGYMAQKCDDVAWKQYCSTISPHGNAQSEMKKAAYKVDLVKGFRDKQLKIMLDLLRLKFRNNPELANKLVATYPRMIMEGNVWNDRYWGATIPKQKHCHLSDSGELEKLYEEFPQYFYVGQNYLGRLLMKVRDELLNK